MKLLNRIIIMAVAAVILFVTAASDASAQAQPSQPVQQTAPSAEAHVEYGSLQSAALGRELKFAIQLPPSYEQEPKRSYAVLYFLHGLNGNEGEFQRRGVAAAVSKMREGGKIGEFIIVAPNGENSFYLNAKNGARFEDAIVMDLIPHIEKKYRVIGTQAARAIQGISMGGFGALMIAFKHPQMFSSVTAHSSALFIELPDASGTDRRSVFMARLIGKMYGDPPDANYFRANNPLSLAETNAAAIKKSGLKIYFDVGEQDRYGFQDANKALDERLTKAGLAHEFHVFPGGHGWEYMLSVADKSFTFLWKNFKLPAKPASAARAQGGR